MLGAVDAADLIPERLPRKGLVVVEDRKGPSWVAFNCPCREHHRLMVRLSASSNPHWRLDGDKRLSLRPSIDSHDDGRRCHFWLTNGKIRWVGDSR